MTIDVPISNSIGKMILFLVFKNTLQWIYNFDAVYIVLFVKNSSNKIRHYFGMPKQVFDSSERNYMRNRHTR